MNLKKALIVDDSRLAQFVLKKMLVEQDMAVDTSASAEEALGYLSNHSPDVIFLDHTMPGMNGLEVLKVIKDNPETAPIPVMMYTSQEDSTYMNQARDLGAIDVLPKQLSPSDLEKVLTQLNLTTTVNTGEDITNNNIVVESVVLENLYEEDKEELEQLVRNAETALTSETIQQQLEQKIEQQREKFEQEISELNEKFNTLIPTKTDNDHKQNLWSNIFWAAVYSITIAIFAIIYFQQKNDIQLLSRSQLQTPATDLLRQPTASAGPRGAQTSLADSVETIQGGAGNQQELSILENAINSNNQIPYGELLLGDGVQTTLNELIPTLQNINFSGRLNIQAHDGTFCLVSNTSGQFEMAADDTPVTQCEITEASARLADISSIGLLQLITASNQSPDSNFIITINPLGNNLPLEDYPAITEQTSAGEWNNIALRNRRVEMRFIDEGP